MTQSTPHQARDASSVYGHSDLSEVPSCTSMDSHLSARLQSAGDFALQALIVASLCRLGRAAFKK